VTKYKPTSVQIWGINVDLTPGPSRCGGASSPPGEGSKNIRKVYSEKENLTRQPKDNLISQNLIL
jgi:hypothetical protein